MSISNIDRMRDALIRDEINYLATLSKDDLFRQCEGLIIEKYHNMAERYITIEYENLE